MSDYPDGAYVVDRDCTVWLVVRDGGMATRAWYGGVVSIGIAELERTLGPLSLLDLSGYGR